MYIGDKDFWNFWKLVVRTQDRETARQVLEELMELVQMPDDLSGQLEENQRLVSHFAVDLPPHHAFWRQLSRLVQVAFPKNDLSKEGQLERQIHQFRYVISSQQAQYVRRYYGQEGQTDAQALAAYLKGRCRFSYQLNGSARFHNKVSLSHGEIHYPGSKESYNIKILMTRFHTEFIVSSDGHFLNEVDAQTVTEEGIVNGASFNYGHFGRHWELDVDPVGPHDPSFRNHATKPYRSPKYSKKKWGCQLPSDYEWSYFNSQGLYAKGGLSPFERVQQEVAHFRSLIKSSKHRS